MEILVNENGITVKQLKELVKDLPEKYDNGEDCTVWIGHENSTSDDVIEICPLNVRDGGVCDIILIY